MKYATRRIKSVTRNLKTLIRLEMRLPLNEKKE